MLGKHLFNHLYQSPNTIISLVFECIVNLHQVDIAKKYSNRIIALNKGEKIFDDKPEHLTDNMIEFIYKDEELD